MDCHRAAEAVRASRAEDGGGPARCALGGGRRRWCVLGRWKLGLVVVKEASPSPAGNMPASRRKRVHALSARARADRGRCNCVRARWRTRLSGHEKTVGAWGKCANVNGGGGRRMPWMLEDGI